MQHGRRSMNACKCEIIALTQEQRSECQSLTYVVSSMLRIKLLNLLVTAALPGNFYSVAV